MGNIGKKSTIPYLIPFILIPLIIVIPGLGRMNGIFFPPDEFGYFANAAKILGYDWSKAAEGNGFYAYGYSLILVPLMIFIKSSYTLYRVAILLNAVMCGIAGAVLYIAVTELFDDMEQSVQVFCCLPAALYVGALSYMHYCIAESLILLMFNIVCLCVIRFLREENMKSGIVALAVSILMVAVHYRTIAVPIAVLVVLAPYVKKFFDRNTYAKTIRRVLIAGGVILIIAVAVIAVLMCKTSYVEEQIARIRLLFVPANVIALFVGIMGKVFYITVASWGLGIIAVKMLFEQNRMFAIFSVVTATLEIIISSVFFAGANHLDYIIYGRYMEYIFPLIIVAGMAGLMKVRNLGKYLYGNIIYVLSFVIVVNLFLALCGESVEYRGDFIPAVAWAVGGRNNTVAVIFVKIAIFFVISQLVIWLFAGKSINSKRVKILGTIIASTFVLLTVRNVNSYVYPAHELDKYDIDLFEIVEELAKQNRKPVFLSSPDSYYVGLLQYYFPNQSIEVIEGGSDEAYNTSPDDIILTYLQYEDENQLFARYKNAGFSEHFRLYYN